MKDQNVHGVVGSIVQQTHCGLGTDGRKITHDPLKVTCSNCIAVMNRTEDIPNLSGPVVKRGRGRPSGSGKKG